MKNLQPNNGKTEEENRIRDQSIKNLPIEEGDGEENWKIIRCRYCQWKNFLTWTKDREEKTEISGEKRDVIVDEGLGW